MGRDAEPRSAPASAEKKKHPAASFIGGASAGLVSSVLLQPFEVVKTKMQAEKLRGARGMVNVAADVVKTNGMKGLWSGVSASCVRTTAGAGLYFFLLERVTRELAASFNKEKATPFERSAMTFGAGCSARTVAAVLLNPITVVKTRMEYAGANAGARQGLVATLANVARKEGAGGVVFGARKHCRSRCAFLRAQFIALHPDAVFDARSGAHAEPRSRGGGHVYRRRARGGGGHVSHAPSRRHSYPSSARANNDAKKR